MLQKFSSLSPAVGDGPARVLLTAGFHLGHQQQNPRLVADSRSCIVRRRPVCFCGLQHTPLYGEYRGNLRARLWPFVQTAAPRGEGEIPSSPAGRLLLHSAAELNSSPAKIQAEPTAAHEPHGAATATKPPPYETEQNSKKRKKQKLKKPEPDSATCGFSYSNFVRKCAELLTERQLERVAIRLKVYRNLKLKPRQQNKLAVIRDIGKIVPTEHRCELTKLLAASLDVVDPHHFLRLSKATTERLATQDEVGDGMPQSIMGDYTVGAELLRSQHRSKAPQRSAALTDADGCTNKLQSADPPPDDILNPHREIATRPPTPTRLTEKRIGEFVVDWQDPSLPEPGSRSKNLVFLSNLPHAPKHILTDILCKAFSGCGKIQELEIFDDRLRTLDQTEDNTLQAKGEQAISDKLEKRFSPIFALAEFSSTQEKQNACSTYLRTFGVPCIDRLVYPEDAAVKTTLIATNLPFILTPDEIARILSFALVHDEEATSHYPGVCRIRMTNPKLFGYEQLLVEARSDAAEPFFLLPLHKKMPNAEAVDHGSPTERTKQGKDRLRPSRNAETSSSLALKDTLGNDISEVSRNTTRSQIVESCEQGLLEKSASATGCNGYCESRDVVSAIADESIFIPSIVGLQTDEEMRYHQNTGRVPNVPGKKFDIGRHVVKKWACRLTPLVFANVSLVFDESLGPEQRWLVRFALRIF